MSDQSLSQMAEQMDEEQLFEMAEIALESGDDLALDAFGGELIARRDD